MTNVTQDQHKLTLNPERAMFPISVIAGILKVHQRTLRIYDEVGLLSPSRSPKKRRMYSFCDIERGKIIQYLTRELGINLSGVKIILHLLEQQNINTANILEYIKTVAEDVNITLEIQTENRIKLSRRGRKPTKKDI